LGSGLAFCLKAGPASGPALLRTAATLFYNPHGLTGGGGEAVVVPEPVMGTSVCRAAVDDVHTAESGPPLVLDHHGLDGPSLGLKASLA
jgi:hypothetical protein